MQKQRIFLSFFMSFLLFAVLDCGSSGSITQASSIKTRTLWKNSLQKAKDHEKKAFKAYKAGNEDGIVTHFKYAIFWYAAAVEDGLLSKRKFVKKMKKIKKKLGEFFDQIRALAVIKSVNKGLDALNRGDSNESGYYGRIGDLLDKDKKPMSEVFKD